VESVTQYKVSAATIIQRIQATFLVDQVMADMGEAGEIPPGLSNNGNANTLSYKVIDLEDGFAEILLYEPIGAVKSQLPSNPGKGS
jgi:hypothetical protein